MSQLCILMERRHLFYAKVAGMSADAVEMVNRYH